MSQQWWVAVGGQQAGPFSLEQVYAQIQSGHVPRDAYVCSSAMSEWAPIASVQEFSQAFSGGDPAPPSPPPQTGAAHEIEFVVHGAEMQYVEITLDPQEAAIAEAGAFMYKDAEIQMETIFGDGSQQGSGFFSKMLSAGKRVLTGESLFMTAYGNAGQSRQRVAFAAPYPGKIIPVDLRQHGNVMLCQKDAFLCAAKGVSVGLAFQKKLGAGFFGGEGFILQKLEGDGISFLHACGSIHERRLQAGDVLHVDTGCLVALEQTVQYDIEYVGGLKSALFGGEGLFFAKISGPGKIWLQSLPFSRLAGTIASEVVKRVSGRGTGER